MLNAVHGMCAASPQVLVGMLRWVTGLEAGRPDIREYSGRCALRAQWRRPHPETTAALQPAATRGPAATRFATRGPGCGPLPATSRDAGSAGGGASRGKPPPAREQLLCVQLCQRLNLSRGMRSGLPACLQRFSAILACISCGSGCRWYLCAQPIWTQWLLFSGAFVRCRSASYAIVSTQRGGGPCEYSRDGGALHFRINVDVLAAPFNT